MGKLRVALAGDSGPHHLKIHWDKENLTWEDWAMAVRYYYARVSMIDSQIGRLYDYLEASGELDNTVLIFTADHGETLGSHGGLLDKGWHHFEETHHVPMIIRLPDGSHAGERVQSLLRWLICIPRFWIWLVDITMGMRFTVRRCCRLFAVRRRLGAMLW